MSKIYRLKDRLVINLPSDVVDALHVKEGDELDFFHFRDSYFIIAKKSDILELITSQQQQKQAQQVAAGSAYTGPTLSVSPAELAVLKKLDTIKYGDRTKDRLKEALNSDERAVLQGLIKKKYVVPFKKPGEQHYKYGIAKSVYNQFLFGKRAGPGERRPEVMPREVRQQVQAPMALVQKKWEKELVSSDAYLSLLETNGFLVVQTEAEAANLSTALEESIRRGLVVGTRAFNKKYYVMLKSFINKNSQAVLKAVGSKKSSVESVSKETGIGEEGVRAILYILAENGDAIEVSRDVFKAI